MSDYEHDSHDRPAPVDPATVQVGDVVEVEADDGSWMVYGDVVSTFRDDYHHPIGISMWGGTCIAPNLLNTTVRRIRAAEPDPDPAQVEALWRIGNRIGDEDGHADPRRDQVAEALHRQQCGCTNGDDRHRWPYVRQANTVLPILRAAVDQARAETAETIAQALDARAQGFDQSMNDYTIGVGDGLREAADIARQHGEQP